MTEEQLRQRREELRTRREQRERLEQQAMLRKIQRKRKFKQFFICVILIGLASCITVFCVRFPAYYQKIQEEQQIKTIAQADPASSSNTAETNAPSPKETESSIEIKTEDPEKKKEQEKDNQSDNDRDFSQTPGYQAKNETRYQNYQASTNYSDAETVWRVNARLDLVAYQDIVTIDTNKVNTDPLVIINKYHRVPDGYQPPDLKANADGCLLRAETADAFDRMKRDAAAQGLNLRAVSGYRSVDYQRNLYNSYLAGDSRENVDTYSARAGHSEHHTGMAVDVFGSVDGLGAFVNTPEYTWVKQHGHEYGFIIRYTTQWESVTGYMDEPWHLRYIGTMHATEMRNRGINTLEEYVGMTGTLE